MSENIFILGAGFSVPSGLPPQAKIVEKIISEYNELPTRLFRDIFNATTQEQIRKIPLEDVFTFFDRAKRNNESFDNGRAGNLFDGVNWLIDSIANTLNSVGDRRLNSYHPFFKSIVDKRVGANTDADFKSDPVSIISLNWDTIPDYLINLCGKDRCMVDYTCYDNDLDEDANHIPSINIKAKGNFNLKIIKPHGSLNWYTCPYCNRLYINRAVESPISSKGRRHYRCRYCTNSKLERLIITPTLLKDLNNTHMKMIWHNMMIDLQEAKRIVFIGYSFPMADYEFRYTILRAVRSTAKIRVLLHPSDLKISRPEEKWIRDQTEERYRSLFCGYDIDFKYGDALEFSNNENNLWVW